MIKMMSIKLSPLSPNKIYRIPSVYSIHGIADDAVVMSVDDSSDRIKLQIFLIGEGEELPEARDVSFSEQSLRIFTLSYIGVASLANFSVNRHLPYLVMGKHLGPDDIKEEEIV